MKKTNLNADLSRFLLGFRIQKLLMYILVFTLLVTVNTLPVSPSVPSYYIILLNSLFIVIIVFIGYFEFSPIWSSTACKKISDDYCDDVNLIESEHEYYKKCTLIDFDSQWFKDLPATHQECVEKINENEILKAKERIAEIERLKEHARIWHNLSKQNLAARIWRMCTWNYQKLSETETSLALDY